MITRRQTSPVTETENPAAVESATGSTPEGVTGDGPEPASYADTSDRAMPDNMQATTEAMRSVTYVSRHDGALYWRSFAASDRAPQLVRDAQATLSKRHLLLLHDPAQSAAENAGCVQQALRQITQRKVRRSLKRVPARLLTAVQSAHEFEVQSWAARVAERDQTIAQLSAAVASLTSELERARMTALLIGGGR